MYFLLNRLAWVVSLIVGILVALYFMGYEHYEFAVWI
jgi:hypothetical protein